MFVGGLLLLCDIDHIACRPIGVIVGFFFYAGLISIVTQIIRSQTGVVLEPLAFNPVMLWEPVAFVLLGALAGIIPAIKAYRTDVAQNLTPHS